VGRSADGALIGGHVADFWPRALSTGRWRDSRLQSARWPARRPIGRLMTDRVTFLEIFEIA
jgi:hypothetical protein